MLTRGTLSTSRWIAKEHSRRDHIDRKHHASLGMLDPASQARQEQVRGASVSCMVLRLQHWGVEKRVPTDHNYNRRIHLVLQKAAKKGGGSRLRGIAINKHIVWVT